MKLFGMTIKSTWHMEHPQQQGRKGSLCQCQCPEGCHGQGLEGVAWEDHLHHCTPGSRLPMPITWSTSRWHWKVLKRKVVQRSITACQNIFHQRHMIWKSCSHFCLYSLVGTDCRTELVQWKRMDKKVTSSHQTETPLSCSRSCSLWSNH